MPRYVLIWTTAQARFPVPETGEVVLGRDADLAQLVIPVPTVSARHARLWWAEGALWIEDLGSTNGTFVNGRRVTAPRRLHPGDEIGLGRQTVLRLEEEAPEPPPEPEPEAQAEPEAAADGQQAPAGKKTTGSKKTGNGRTATKRASTPVVPPTEDVLIQVKTDICRLVELMGYPSEVTLRVEDTALRCHISGEHEDELVGSEGRTLDSMQYLLRKMTSSRLPDRMMLSLDAGDFRQRRAEELKNRALQLAEEVKETGKTQAIPALNPAERREVHMILQADKAIRSRSVGDGLFKKILIYKPGKGNKSSSRKRRGRQSGRSTEN